MHCITLDTYIYINILLLFLYFLYVNENVIYYGYCSVQIKEKRRQCNKIVMTTHIPRVVIYFCTLFIFVIFFLSFN